MALLIRGGRIITATEDFTGDIYAEHETITRIEPRIDDKLLAPGTDIVDARGKYVFPGFIDPHVHIYLPFMGTYAADDYESASKAALAGGTTTLIEMICPGASDEPFAAFELWKSKAEKLAAVDYTFHMSIVRFEEHIRAQFRDIVKAGVASFKVFLAYKGALLAAGKTGPEWHGPSRPPVVEADGVHHLCTFAELLGTHVYIVHTSCEPAVRAALDARKRGVNVWIESVIPHFVLDETYAERAAFEGAKYVMSPPLRAKANQGVLWNGVKSREISTIATDHAPFRFEDQKKMGRDAFTKIPNGIPSVQERVDLVHTWGVAGGRMSVQAMVDACSTQAAKLFGLYPKKGTIQLGSDADLVVYDPSYRGTFSKECSYSNVDYNAYEGWEQKGRASVVTVRGQVQARDGEFVGTIGRGQFLKREPTH